MPITWPYNLTDGSIADADHVMANFEAAEAEIDLKAPLTSPVFLGTPEFPAAGFKIGADVNLYRNAANVLRTDDTLIVGVELESVGDVYARHGQAGQVRLTDGGLTGGMIIFGVAGDTNLYRQSASLLRTDDQFRAASLISDGPISATGLITAQNGYIPGHVDSGQKIIHGRVTSGGAVAGGNGFTVVRNSLGDYTITFTTPFSAVPAVVVSTVDTSTEVVLSNNLAAGSFKANTFSGNLTIADHPFSFIAIGPA